MKYTSVYRCRGWTRTTAHPRLFVVFALSVTSKLFHLFQAAYCTTYRLSRQSIYRYPFALAPKPARSHRLTTAGHRASSLQIWLNECPRWRASRICWMISCVGVMCGCFYLVICFFGGVIGFAPTTCRLVCLPLSC